MGEGWTLVPTLTQPAKTTSIKAGPTAGSVCFGRLSDSGLCRLYRTKNGSSLVAAQDRNSEEGRVTTGLLQRVRAAWNVLRGKPVIAHTTFEGGVRILNGSEIHTTIIGNRFVGHRNQR